MSNEGPLSALEGGGDLKSRELSIHLLRNECAPLETQDFGLHCPQI